MNYLNKLTVKLQTRMKDEKGQTMVEYALLLALIAVLLIGGITALEGGVAGTFATVTGSL